MVNIEVITDYKLRIFRKGEDNIIDHNHTMCFEKEKKDRLNST